MFKATKVLQMQPSRMLFMKQTAPLFMRQTAPLYLRQTSRMMNPPPVRLAFLSSNYEHVANT